MIVVIGDVINDILTKAHDVLTPNSDNRATITIVPGGSASNTAAWLGALGADVSFVGRVGKADIAQHTKVFRDIGVTPYLVADPELPTGSIVVVVDRQGDRTMFVDRAANLELKADDIPHELLVNADHVHLTGYTFFEEGTRKAAVEILHRARQAGRTTSVDPSSITFLREIGIQNFIDLTAGVDLFFPNRDEAQELTGLADPIAAAEKLNETYEHVIVTLDGEGAVIKQRGQPAVQVPAQIVAAIDTTGAGDAFCAGYLNSWLDGGGLKEAAKAGTVLAALAVTQLGARPPSVNGE